MTSATTPMRALCERLQQEHVDLDAALERLFQAFETGDQEIARDAFRAFDRQLSQHLRIEDELLLPDYADVNPVEAAELATEHRVIRAKADELAVGGDLHIARVSELRDLADLLRRHAQREDQMLYRWVAESLDVEEPTRAADESGPRVAPAR